MDTEVTNVVHITASRSAKGQKPYYIDSNGLLQRIGATSSSRREYKEGIRVFWMNDLEFDKEAKPIEQNIAHLIENYTKQIENAKELFASKLYEKCKSTSK